MNSETIYTHQKIGVTSNSKKVIKLATLLIAYIFTLPLLGQENEKNRSLKEKEEIAHSLSNQSTEKSSQLLAFNTDIVIQASANARKNVKLSNFKNGWVFAGISTFTNNVGGITLMRSKNNGATWSVIAQYTATAVEYKSFDILASGPDTNNLILTLVGNRFSISNSSTNIFIDRYNGKTGAFLNSTYNLSKGSSLVYDLAIASDYEFPASGTSPYGIGFIYSCFSSTLDSVVFIGSANAGQSWTIRNLIKTTTSFNGKVSISYAKSASPSNGRYIAAWEQRSGASSRTGNIYTARNATFINTGWTAPKNLDSLSSTMIGLCRNPRIVSYYGTVDNDSANVTTAIFVDRDYVGNGSDYDILGFYNKKSCFTNFWYRFDVLNNGVNSILYDAVFNPVTNKFNVMFLDSSAKQIYIQENIINMTTPSTWAITSSLVNDSLVGMASGLGAIDFDRTNGKLSTAWIQTRASGIPQALYDYDGILITTAISENVASVGNISYYPNPSNGLLNIKSDEPINDLQIIDMLGKVVYSNRIELRETVVNLMFLNSGVYFIKTKNGTSKFIKS